jgi:FMN phosphatase YigB (HAD superfamily)
MKQKTIIWDFDGTLLPSDLYDSEQSLMLYKLQETRGQTFILTRISAKLLIFADSEEHLRRSRGLRPAFSLWSCHLRVHAKINSHFSLE